LAAVTSASRIAYAFARDGGLPASRALRAVSARYRTPTAAIWTVTLAAVLSTVYTAVYETMAAAAAILLYMSYVLPTALGLAADRRRPGGLRPPLDRDGSLAARPLVPSAGRGERGRLPGPHRDRHAPSEPEERLDRGRPPARAGDGLVRRGETPVPGSARGAGAEGGSEGGRLTARPRGARDRAYTPPLRTDSCACHARRGPARRAALAGRPAQGRPPVGRGRPDDQLHRGRGDLRPPLARVRAHGDLEPARLRRLRARGGAARAELRGGVEPLHGDGRPLPLRA